MGVSTSDDCESAEIQTDLINYASKWVQCPPSFKPQQTSQKDGSGETTIPSISREEFLGVGSGYDPLCSHDAACDGHDYNSSTDVAFTFDVFAKSDGVAKDSSTFDDLRQFVESAGRLILSVLQEERSSMGEGSETSAAGKNKAAMDAIPFGTGSVHIGVNGDGKFDGRPVKKILFSPFAPLLMMTCHEGDGSGTAELQKGVSQKVLISCHALFDKKQFLLLKRPQVSKQINCNLE